MRGILSREIVGVARVIRVRPLAARPCEVELKQNGKRENAGRNPVSELGATKDQD